MLYHLKDLGEKFAVTIDAFFFVAIDSVFLILTSLILDLKKDSNTGLT